MHCGRMCACLATRFLRLALRPRNLPPKRRVGTIFVKNWYWLGGHLRAQLRGGGSMPIFAVGPRRNRVYTQAREPALYCCLRPEISPAAKCWPELRCSPVLSIWPPKPSKQPNVRVPHLPMESWSGINQVTEPPAVMLLESDRELAPGQWQVGGLLCGRRMACLCHHTKHTPLPATD